MPVPKVVTWDLKQPASSAPLIAQTEQHLTGRGGYRMEGVKPGHDMTYRQLGERVQHGGQVPQLHDVLVIQMLHEEMTALHHLQTTNTATGTHSTLSNLVKRWCTQTPDENPPDERPP